MMNNDDDHDADDDVFMIVMHAKMADIYNN
jgi:hypothetical protein